MGEPGVPPWENLPVPSHTLPSLTCRERLPSHPDHSPARAGECHLRRGRVRARHGAAPAPGGDGEAREPPGQDGPRAARRAGPLHLDGAGRHHRLQHPPRRHRSVVPHALLRRLDAGGDRVHPLVPHPHVPQRRPGRARAEVDRPPARGEARRVARGPARLARQSRQPARLAPPEIGARHCPALRRPTRAGRDDHAHRGGHPPDRGADGRRSPPRRRRCSTRSSTSRTRRPTT